MYCQELKSFKQTKSSVVTKEGLKQQVPDIEETDLNIGSNDVADVNIEETYVNIGCNKVADVNIDCSEEIAARSVTKPAAVEVTFKSVAMFAANTKQDVITNSHLPFLLRIQSRIQY